MERDIVQRGSRLPSSLSQFEETIGHRRGRRCGDGEALVDGFQDKTAVEAPGECAEVARQMFGVDHTMRGQETVLDVGQHCVRPAEGGVARCGALRAGDMSLMENAWLLGNAAKPLAAIADDSGSGPRTAVWFRLLASTVFDRRTKVLPPTRARTTTKPAKSVISLAAIG